MASDDALAESHGQSRRRWFGRGAANTSPTQQRESDMAPGEPVISESAAPPDRPRPDVPVVKASNGAGPGADHAVESAKPGAPRAESPTPAPTVSDEAGADVVVEQPTPAPLPVAPEALAALRARGGEHGDEEVVLPLIISIANQKGGVGKTTTAVNLGAALAELEYRVLVIDLDPQGNATTGMGISHRNVEGSIYDVIMNDAPIDDCTEPTTVKNLFVVPATIDLAGAEIELVPAFSRELKLRRALAQIAGSYDFTLIDCPPSLGLLTVNGLEYYALEGLGQLLRNVALVKSNLNPALDVRGIVLTMYDARTKLAEQVEREVRAHFGAKVYRTVVPRTVRISEAPSFGQPVTVFDSTSRGALAYRELAKEVSRGATRRAG
jgi:chromosome partitioning protein